MFSIIVLISLLVSYTTSLPQGWRPSPTSLRFAIDANFPDPSFVKVDDSFYAFATRNGQQNVPLAVSNDFINWDLTGEDAMPTVPSWSGGGIWAPDVVQLADGSFVMYMSAQSLVDPTKHCVGMAKSAGVTGPYIPVDTSICPLDQGGAIDPAGFQDADGSQWIVYKVDGNSLGGGGTCGNGDNSHATPIMLQQVSPETGVDLIGDPIVILDHGEFDGPLVEAPSLMRTSEGVYVLFFSSNCYNSELYDSSYATSTTGVRGPYTKSTAPLLVSGDDGNQLKSPGGLDVGPAGVNIVFHSDLNAGDASVRQMWTGQLSIQGTNVQIL